MRFDDPKIVVFLGMAAVGIFSIVFAFNYFKPSLFQTPVFPGYSKNPFFQTNGNESTSGGTNLQTNEPAPTKQTPLSPTPSKIPTPAIPKNLTSSIVLNESQLNQLIASAFKGNSNLETPQISLSGDSISISFTLISPIKGNVTANATIKTVNSEAQINLTQVKINNFPMPKFLVAMVEGQLNSTLNGYLMKVPFLRIEKIYVQNSKLIIEGAIPTTGLF